MCFESFKIKSLILQNFRNWFESIWTFILKVIKVSFWKRKMFWTKKLGRPIYRTVQRAEAQQANHGPLSLSFCHWRVGPTHDVSNDVTRLQPPAHENESMSSTKSSPRFGDSKPLWANPFAPIYRPRPPPRKPPKTLAPPPPGCAH